MGHEGFNVLVAQGHSGEDLSAGVRGPQAPAWIVFIGAFTDEGFESVNHFRVDAYINLLCVQFLMICLCSIALLGQILEVV